MKKHFLIVILSLCPTIWSMDQLTNPKKDTQLQDTISSLRESSNYDTTVVLDGIINYKKPTITIETDKNKPDINNNKNQKLFIMHSKL